MALAAETRAWLAEEIAAWPDMPGLAPKRVTDWGDGLDILPWEQLALSL